LEHKSDWKAKLPKIFEESEKSSNLFWDCWEDKENDGMSFYETGNIPEKKVREYYFQQYSKYFSRIRHINERY
jgi:hypothetical protein